MPNAPVCHISVNQGVVRQPKPTLLPSIGVPVDLPSAITVINQLKIIIQNLVGQPGTGGLNGFAGPAGAGGVGGVAGVGGPAGAAGAGVPGAQGKKGDSNRARYVEDRSQRVTEQKRIYQDNDNTSANYVDIAQINRVVWVDTVTGSEIVWSR